MKKVCMILVLVIGVFLVLGMVPGCKKKLPTQPDIPTKVLPTIEYFHATPETMSSGESSILSWSVKNATNVTIDPDVGTVSATGAVEIIPEETTIYTLIAINSDGQTEASCTVHVIPNYQGTWRGFYIISNCQATNDFAGWCESFPLDYQWYIELNLLQVQDQVTGCFFLGRRYAETEGSIEEDGQLLLTGLITEEGSPITIDVEMQLQSTTPGQITGGLSQLVSAEGISGYIQSSGVITLSQTSTMTTTMAPSAPRMRGSTLEDLIRALRRR